MKALAVRPRAPNSARLVEVPPPSPLPHETRVRVLEVGLCGTDAEIVAGLYGDAPPGEELLILGHEALGRLDDGRLVVPMVRRPCATCAHCAAGHQDMCDSDAFTERGIRGAHGALCEVIVEDPRQLVFVPETARAHAVLLEPMSVVAKGLRHTLLIQRRLDWKPRRALVLGAGPIGQLATLTLRTLGWEVVAVARRPAASPKAALVRSVGARYHSVTDASLKDLAAQKESFDFVFEATGSAEAAFDAMRLLAPNGVLCLTSVTGGDKTLTVPADRLNYDLVLGNRLVFGTVNANRVDFVEGLERLAEIERVFPGALAKLITARATFADGARVFAPSPDGIKTVLAVAPD